MSRFQNGSSRRFAPANRRHHEFEYDEISWYFCFGDCAKVNSYLNAKVGWTWIVPKFLNALFRGIGQVAFSNNPFSGFLVLIGIFCQDWTVGFLVFGAACTALLTAVFINIHPQAIVSGGITFNSVLLASVTGSLWTPLYNEPIPLKVYIFVILGSSFSVLISNGLNNILSSLKPSVPILAYPFHILVLLLFISLKPNVTRNQDPLKSSFVDDDTIYNESLRIPDGQFIFAQINGTDETGFYSWGTLQNVALGIIFSAGQVVGAANLMTSVLIYTAVLMYSPILTLMVFQGAIIGTLSGLFMTPFPDQSVFLGVWGFNGFLCCGAIGIFYIFNCYSFLNGTVTALFASVLQFVLTPCLVQHNLPVFGLPFILSTVLFICVTSNGQQLVRSKTITFPEQQRRNYLHGKNDDTEAEPGRNLI